MRAALFVVAVFLAVPIGVLSQDSSRNCRDRFRSVLEGNAGASLAHFQLGECLWSVKDRAGAVNEFHEALKGDLKPRWISVWAHLNLGKIFDSTGQRERALQEYRRAAATNDNTRGAQDEVAKYRQSAYIEK